MKTHGSKYLARKHLRPLGSQGQNEKHFQNMVMFDIKLKGIAYAATR